MPNPVAEGPGLNVIGRSLSLRRPRANRPPFLDESPGSISAFPITSSSWMARVQHEVWAIHPERMCIGISSLSRTSQLGRVLENTSPNSVYFYERCARNLDVFDLIMRRPAAAGSLLRRRRHLAIISAGSIIFVERDRVAGLTGAWVMSALAHEPGRQELA